MSELCAKIETMEVIYETKRETELNKKNENYRPKVLFVLSGCVCMGCRYVPPIGRFLPREITCTT